MGGIYIFLSSAIKNLFKLAWLLIFLSNSNVAQLASSCPETEVMDKNEKTCLRISTLDNPILSQPYISGYTHFGDFNATAFSVDCAMTLTRFVRVIHLRTLKAEVLFWMDGIQVRDGIILDFTSCNQTKATLEESYLKEHIGKTLTCSAQLFFVSENGYQTTRTHIVKSGGYHFGIHVVDSNGAVVKEIQMSQGIPVEIYLQATFPITFGHCVKAVQCNVRKYSFTTKENKVSQNNCQINFENLLGQLVYKSTTTIKFLAKVTPGIEHTRTLLEFNIYTIASTVIFKNFMIPPVPIIVLEKDSLPTCESHGDPHIMSFRGLNYDNFLTGDFNLLSSHQRRFQIQTRLIPCFRAPGTCNCGMIAREGNYVIGINSCDYLRTPQIFEVVKKNAKSSASFKQVHNDYQIEFMSGIKIKASILFDPHDGVSYLNIYVSGLKHEEYDGMCAASWMPNLELLRIPSDQSFFKGQFPPCVEEIFNSPACKCVGNRPESVSTVCDFDGSVKDDKLARFEYDCTPKQGRKRSIDEEIAASLTSKRNRRSKLTLNDLFKSINHSIDNQIFKEITKMPLKEAQDHCSKELKKSKYYEKCKEVLKDKYQVLVQSCTDDLQLSGRTTLASHFLNVYEEKCMITISKEVEIVDGEPSPESSAKVELLNDINATSAERKANASTPWNYSVKKIKSISMQLEPSSVILLHCSIVIVNAITSNGLF